MTTLYAGRCPKADLLAVVLVDDAGFERLRELSDKIDEQGNIGANVPSFLKIVWVPSVVVEAATCADLSGPAHFRTFEALEAKEPEAAFTQLQGHDQAATPTELIVRPMGRIHFEMDPSEDGPTVKSPEFPKPHIVMVAPWPASMSEVPQG